MEFCQALKEISKKDGFSFLDEGFDKFVFKSLPDYLKEKEENLQILEYDAIIRIAPAFGLELSRAYLESKKKKDPAFEGLLEKIEEISFLLEKSSLSKDIYSYFIYSYLELFTTYFEDKELFTIGIEKIEHKNPEICKEKELVKRKKGENGFYILDKTLYKYRGKSPIAIIPPSVNAIGYGAFMGNKKIKAVYIPNSVSKIEKEAFSGCSNLETVLMSKKVDTLLPFTFFGCKSLKEIDIDGIKIENGCFMGCTKMAVEK
ncbi:MAG: leucine-rich repeat domain-containing protein [Ruminococcaceae bacterium]|nr:leucine-rich repeat domain-containing protein [Oscillospiraceae bacterium]